MEKNNRAYYTHRLAGEKQDFFTNPAIHAAFGSAIARQILEMDTVLGSPHPFVFFEFGGGTGQLAVDILKTLQEESPNFFSRFYYGVSDFTESLAFLNSRIRREFPEMSGHFLFFPPYGPDFPDHLPAFPGCIFANEFLDALPVHYIVKRGTGFQEIFLAEKPEGYEFAEFPLSSPLKDFLKTYPMDLEEGCFAEINLEMQSWVHLASSTLKQGFVLVVDYGGLKEELHGSRYPEGTLRGFKYHRLADIFTLQLGEADWTSDIDFSTLAKIAEQEGFSVTGFSTQSNFLLGTGAAEQLPLFRKKNLDLKTMKEHLAMKFLFHPEGVGNAFHVLGLHKGTENPKLSGFRMRQEKL